MVKIVFASQATVFDHQGAVQRVLDAIGYPEAFVTDESSIGDFPIEKEDLPALRQKLAVSVALDDLIVDVAMRLAHQ